MADWVDLWAEEWEKAKEKMKRKIRGKGAAWKEGSLSPKAQAEYITEVVKAAVEGRREKGIENVNPAEWEEATITGIDQKTLTDIDKQKMASRAAPYIDLIQRIRKEFKEIAWPSWREAANFWQNVVNTYLSMARKKPELIPEIERQIMAKLNEMKSRYGKEKLTPEKRKALVSAALGKATSS